MARAARDKNKTLCKFMPPKYFENIMAFLTSSKSVAQ